MTDKIIISRKEIEELFAKYDMGRLSLSVIVDLRALLDKAEVSEPVASEFDKFHKEAYEVRIHQLETANETAKFVIRGKDKELTTLGLHNRQLLDALKEASALAGDPRERDYDLIWELLNRTIASVPIYAPPLSQPNEPVGQFIDGRVPTVVWLNNDEHDAMKSGDFLYKAPPDQSAKIAELEAEIAKLTAIIEDMKVVDNVFGVGDKKDGESGTKYCCIESWKKAKDEAWSKRNFKLCKCDHCESCEHCYPPEFHTGGKWDLCKPREALAKVEG